MDALTQKAFDSLQEDILPRLNQAMADLSEVDSQARQPTDDLKFLCTEARALLIFLEKWAFSSAGEASEEQDLGDEDAQMLLAEMDAPTEEVQVDSADIGDDEAQMLLAEMDAPVQEEGGEIDDDEAHKMLAEMDAPVDANSSDMSDEEAKKLLADMDSGGDGLDPETLAMLRDEESKTETPEADSAEQAPADDSEINAEEEVGEIDEFGESEFGSDPDMIKDFLTNSEELMEVLDEQTLALEQSPDNSEIIEEIFRAAHTLKGAAGMFAYQAIERVMHRTENFFDQVRKGKLQATSDAVDVVLESLDVIKTLINAVRDGKPSGIKTAPIVRKLNAICAGKSVVSDKKNGSPQAKDSAGEEGAKVAEKPKAKKVEQSTIRVDLRRLDALVNLIGELVIDRTRFISIEEELRTKFAHVGVATNMSETVQLFGRHMNEIQDIIMKVRMVPVGNAFNKFPRVVRDLAKSLGKEIDLFIEGENTELDKTLVEQIGDPLVHLIRNAVDHGVEMPDDRVAKGKNSTGRVNLSARQEGNQIIITIEDDGKGMDREVIRQKGIEKGLISKNDNLSDREIFNLIFEAGFSTAAQVTNISGRGVGMDVVKKQISKLKGIIDISSHIGRGSTITIQLPLTLAIVQSLLVQTKHEIFAIPLSAVVESIRIKPSEIQKVGDAEVIKRRNMVLPLLYLHEALDLESKQKMCWYSQSTPHEEERRNSQDRLFVVVVGNAERRFGIVVDTLLNQQEMVIKNMGPVIGSIPCVAGGAILGNGEVVLVLDIAELEDFFRNKPRMVAA